MQVILANPVEIDGCDLSGLMYCPCCHGTNLVLNDYGPIINDSGDEEEAMAIVCRDCNTNGPSGQSVEDASAKWNNGNIREFGWVVYSEPQPANVWIGLAPYNKKRQAQKGN